MEKKLWNNLAINMNIVSYYREVINNILIKEFSLKKDDIKNTSFEFPKDFSLGDFSTNAAMVLSGKLKKSPKQIAEIIINLVLKNDDIVVTDMGLSFVGTHQAFKVKKGQKLFTNSGHAPMGWGLPAAIGASFASKKKIICLTGEGGLQMNIQEFATIMHHKLPIKTFIYNNGGYLTIKQTQQLGFQNRIMGSTAETGLSFPNYKKIAQSHNISYVKLKNNTNLKKNIKKILKNNKPVICELIMDNEQEQMPKAINKRLPNGKSEATKFEDMYPFLPFDEIQKNMI